MVFRECALPQRGGHRGRVKQFSQLYQLRGRLRIQHSLTRVQHRTACFHQNLSDAGNVPRIAGRPSLFLRFVVELFLGNLAAQHVVGHFQQHGIRTPRSQLSVGASHHLGDAFSIIDVVCPLGNALIITRGIKIGRHPVALRAGMSGNHQQRRRVSVGLCYPGEGVFDPWSTLNNANAVFVAVVYPAVCVGHIHCGTLHPGNDGPDPAGGAGINQNIVGKTENYIHAFLSQNIGDSGFPVHICLRNPR